MKTKESTGTRVLRRLDTGGRWHRITSASCDECGCSYDYSVDEPGIIWEAGELVGPNCLDELCDCHVFPVMGLRFRLNMAS